MAQPLASPDHAIDIIVPVVHLPMLRPDDWFGDIRFPAFSYTRAQVADVALAWEYGAGIGARVRPVEAV